MGFVIRNYNNKSRFGADWVGLTQALGRGDGCTVTL